MHRVVYEMHHGPIPEDMQVDHINNNKYDNRIENLRLVTQQANLRNCRKQVNNKTGITGVCQAKYGRWYAYLGKVRVYCASFQEACAERIYLEVSAGNVTARHGV